MVSAVDLAVRIIREQEVIIGPLAWNVARQVEGITIVQTDHVVFSRGGAVVLNGLVKKYQRLFGPASLQVCREAVKGMVDKASDDDVPEVLK